jgi:arylformamidase
MPCGKNMTDQAKIHDISPPLLSDLAVWPGDQPLTRTVMASLEAGDPVTLSCLTATAHLGAHADAPSHYIADGRTMDRQRLDLYLGPCHVVHVDVSQGVRVSRSMLPAELTWPRVLLATGTYPDPTAFSQDFAGLEPQLITALAGEGVRLIGVDTPSVDRFTDVDALPAHAACAAHDVSILEGLVLESVPDGVYELIALPLRLVGFDASPVRAILREIN